ncbi:MAG: phenylalanine--tRNA ligase subunit beta [Thermodesulfobacteriota bacterium]
MKFTLNWLKEYVDIDGLSPSDLADKLTMLGLEVDAVEEIFTELEPLKIAKVVKVDKHPNADKLTLCEVAVGEETFEIVCGAPNVRAGLITVVALPGTVLPGGMKIKKSKVRGIQSFGMLCSERELELSDSHTGIMELDDSLTHGDSFRKALGLDDILVEVDLTPNRPDCTSVIGVAREVAGITGKPLTMPVTEAEITTTNHEFSVDVESHELCPRYGARLIKGVTIGQSPWWLRKKLLSIGLRPINNVVDITNLVMMEYGQPLHAFDFQKLAGGKIVVRTPRSNETTFTTLDDVERKLDKDMLMICDGDKPVAVAGVMGGHNSEVSDDTSDILLESACFNPISTRKTARLLNLATEASYRFERGVDPGGCIVAMERAVQLFCEVAGGVAQEGGTDYYGGQKPLNSQTLRISKTSDLLGIDLDHEKISSLLQSIGIRCKKKDDDTLWVNPPTFRVDIEREVDLVEEVARLIGYDNIPTALPTVQLSYPEQDNDRSLRQEASDILTGYGFYEAINYSFSNEKHLDMMGLAEDDPRRSQVRLLNPLTEDQSVMRTMLIPGLLENVAHNINHQQYSVKLFESGKVFTPTGENEQPLEKTRLAGVLSGNRYGTASPLHFKQEMADILDVKGVAEYLLREIRLYGLGDSLLTFETGDGISEPYIDPGQFLSIMNNNDVLGLIGRVRPEIAKNFGVKQEVFVFDLDFDGLCHLQSSTKDFSNLPVFPAVKRDIALLVPDHISAGALLEAVRASREKLIEQCDVFDVYQGDSVKEGHKSVALSVTYRSPSKTLTEKNVEKAHTKIINMLNSKFEASFREG